MATVQEALAALSGAIGEKVRRGLPESDFVRRIWGSIKDLHDVHGVPEDSMTNIVPESWPHRALRAGEQGASGQSIVGVLPTHDAETTGSSKAPYRLGKLVNRVRYEEVRRFFRKRLPETAPRSRGTGGLIGQTKRETRGVATARQKKPIGTRCRRLFESETCRLLKDHPRVVIRVRGTALFGGSGVPGDEVLLLRCNG